MEEYRAEETKGVTEGRDRESYREKRQQKKGRTWERGPKGTEGHRADKRL